MSAREMPATQVTFKEDANRHALSTAMLRAFARAMEERSHLPPRLFEVEGFSGRRFRMFLNNLFGLIGDPRYLEIGVFKGGSFVPAIYKNKMAATALDNWSWPKADVNLFRKYLVEFSAGVDVRVIDSDFRAVDYTAIGKYNVMFYDGSHEEVDQFDGVSLPAPAMDSEYIVIIDDWNWEHVRRGTFAGLEAAGCRMLASIELLTSLDGQLPLHKYRGMKSDWHNGMFAAVMTQAGGVSG